MGKFRTPRRSRKVLSFLVGAGFNQELKSACKILWNHFRFGRGSLVISARGTSGDLGHTKLSRYRCSLPGLAGFAGLRCTEPEVPRSGSPAEQDCKKKFNTFSC